MSFTISMYPYFEAVNKGGDSRTNFDFEVYYNQYLLTYNYYSTLLIRNPVFALPVVISKIASWQGLRNRVKSRGHLIPIFLEFLKIF